MCFILFYLFHSELLNSLAKLPLIAAKLSKTPILVHISANHAADIYGTPCLDVFLRMVHTGSAEENYWIPVLLIFYELFVARIPPLCDGTSNDGHHVCWRRFQDSVQFQRDPN